MWVCNWDSFNLSQHRSKFDIDRSCGKGCITFVYCQMMSHDITVKISCYLVSAIPSAGITTMPNFKFIRLKEVKTNNIPNITNITILAHCITWTHYQRYVWLDRCETFNLSQHVINIGKELQNSCLSRDVFWFFHVSLQGYLLRSISSNFTYFK